MKILAVSALAASTMLSATAIAAPPNGTFVFKDNTTYDQRCGVGQASSQITQNGQFVSGNSEETEVYDQTTYPGSRADAIQGLLETCRANGQEIDEDAL